MILRLLLLTWREVLVIGVGRVVGGGCVRVDEEIRCLGYAPSCDVIAAGIGPGKLVFIDALPGEKM